MTDEPYRTPSDDSTSGPTESASPSQLRRELGVFGAMMMGLGSIVGTGIFVSVGLAATVAGPAVILAMALAAGVAVCNALSSAQLAAAHPVSGGTYEYGYRFLRPVLGFSAGWLFLLAKSASAATAALGFAGYGLTLLGRDGRWTVPVAAGAVIALTLIVLGGMRRSRNVNVAIVSVTLAALALFVLAGLPELAERGTENYRPFFLAPEGQLGGELGALLYAAALMFVGYTGYGRIATLGEEVHEPRRTIPRAILLTLIVSMVLYGAVAAVAVGVAGVEGIAAAMEGPAAPLEVIARGYRVAGAGVVLAVGAMTAMLGVLLNLVLGLSRVWLAMGRRRDVPAGLAKLDRTGTTPVWSVALVGVTVTGLVLIGDVRLTWSFSALTVLIYYALTNLAALRLPAELQLYPRWVAGLGLAGCLGLAFWIPGPIWLAGGALVAAGLIWHRVAVKMRT